MAEQGKGPRSRGPRPLPVPGEGSYPQQDLHELHAEARRVIDILSMAGAINEGLAAIWWSWLDALVDAADRELWNPAECRRKLRIMRGKGSPFTDSMGVTPGE